jgi:hypothetical protein
VMFKVFEAVWGEKTLPVDDERFKRAWLDLVTRGLGADKPDLARPPVSRDLASRPKPKAAKPKRAAVHSPQRRDASKRRRRSGS